MNSSISPLSSALQQMQTLASQAAGGAGNIASGAVEQQSGAATAGSFADALKSSIDNISQAQQQLTTLLQQAAPDVAAQVNPDPMSVLQKLRDGTLSHDQQISSGFIWPARGPVTQGFGLTTFAIDGAYGGSGHTGVDIGQGAGQPIVAAAEPSVATSMARSRC